MLSKNDVRLPALTAGLVACSMLLAACGGGAPDTAATASPAAPTASTAGRAATLTVTDPWVKTADKGMSAAFGSLVNPTGADVTVVSVTTPVSPKAELHEVAGTGGTGGMAKMRPVKGGFVVPAGGRLELKPGGFHIMLMDVKTPIRPGDQVAFTLTLEDGATVPFSALGKAFEGGNETYAPEG
jgi:copper(I)-binding protein